MARAGMLLCVIAVAACSRERERAPDSPPTPPGLTEAAAVRVPGPRAWATLATSPLVRPITLTLLDGRLEGSFGAAPGSLDVALADPSQGRLSPALGRAEGPADEPWDLGLQDEDGRIARPAPGQILLLHDGRATGAERDQGAVVPGVVLAFDREGGRIGGRVDPETVVAVGLELAPAAPHGSKAREVGASEVAAAGPGGIAPQRPEAPSRIELVASDDGLFEWQPAPGRPLLGGGVLTVTLRTRQGLRVVDRRTVPWVRLFPRSGEVIGAAAPMSGITVELRSASGAPRARGLAWSDALGSFRTTLRDSIGDAVAVDAEERVVVRDGGGSFDLVVPPLTVRADRRAASTGASQSRAARAPLDGTAMRLTGRSAPGATIDLSVWQAEQPGNYAMPRVLADAEGVWTADLGEMPWPRSRVCATEHLASGDAAIDCLEAPVLLVQPGLPVSFVAGPADATARLELGRLGRGVVATAVGSGSGGEVVTPGAAPPGARGAATAAGDAPWPVEFRDTAGRPVPVREGDTVTATLAIAGVEAWSGKRSDGAEAFTVPIFEARLVRGGGGIEGRTEPYRRIDVARGTAIGAPMSAGEDGRFRAAVDPAVRAHDGVAPGARLEVYTILSNGHRVGRVFAGPRLSLSLDRGTVDVSGDPRLAVAVTDPSGGSGAVRAQIPATGTVRLDLPAAPVPDSSWRVTVGQQSLQLDVPTMSVALDRSTGLAGGIGPPGVRLALLVQQGVASAPEVVPVDVRDDGRWSVDLRGAPGTSYRFDPPAVRWVELVYEAAPGVTYRRGQ